MPGFNRRGPENQGVMTGRRMGRCNPANQGKNELSTAGLEDFNALPENAPGMGRGQGGRRLHCGRRQNNV